MLGRRRGCSAKALYINGFQAVLLLGSILLLLEVNAQAKTLKFVQKHIERFGNTGRWHGIAFHYCLICFRAAGNIVTLDGKNFLKDVAGAECLERPNFHFSEALTTKLGFTTQRLLCNKRVRANGASMHLIFNHMAEFQHVNHTDCCGLVEALAGTTIVKISLTITGKPGFIGPIVKVIE